MNKIKEKYYYYVYRFFMNLSIQSSIISYECRSLFTKYEKKYKNIKKLKEK